MTREEVIQYLVKECHLSFEQIYNVTDHQVTKVLCLPSRDPKRMDIPPE